MSEAKLHKYLARLHVNVKRITKQNRPVLLVSDSKGFQLQSADSGKEDNKITYITKAGAQDENINSVFESLATINQKDRSIILIWLGTCDLT